MNAEWAVNEDRTVYTRFDGVKVRRTMKSDWELIRSNGNDYAGHWWGDHEDAMAFADAKMPPPIVYVRRGKVAVGDFGLEDGYSEKMVSGLTSYPWLTKTACRADAAARHRKAVFE